MANILTTLIQKSSRFIRAVRYYNNYHTGRTILPYGPRTVIIEPTSFCNQRCKMCPHSFNKNWEDGHMDMRLFEKIMDEIKDYAIRVIFQHRGEPLLNKDLISMIKLCKEAGLQTGFNTNATMLNEEMSGKLLISGMDSILFSFNGETREVHNSISQLDSFDKMLANVIHFLKMKKKMNLKKPEVIIQVIKFHGFTGESGNFEISPGFKKMFNGLPITSIACQTGINRSGDSKEKCSLHIMAPRCENYMPCRWLWSEAVICWNGNVLPCCFDFNEEYILGNMNKSTLLEIWNGERMIDLRRKLLKGRYAEVSLCKECDVLWMVDQESTFIKRIFAKMLHAFQYI